MKQGRRAQKFTLHHWWTSVIWRMSNWRQNTKNTKVVLYSEAILWKMILTQYSLNKDHQHLKWQPPRSWISSPDCRVAMDKQQTQYQLYTQVKMEDAHKLWKNSQIGMSRTFGIRLPTTQMAQHHGLVWKTQPFLLSGICTVIIWQDCYGKGNLRKSHWNMAGRRFPNWNVSLYIVKKDYSYLCMWMT